MLSRRNIRIKVMQLFYAAGRDETLGLNELSVRYQNYGKNHIELFVFNLAQWVEVARFAIQDEVNRRAKILPTPEDRAFKPKLFNNDVMLPFAESKTYRDAVGKFGIMAKMDIDITRKLYMDFLKTDMYQQYLVKNEHTQAEHRQILLDLYRFLTQNETFNDRMEEIVSWLDDKSLIVGDTKKLIKALPQENLLTISFIGEDKLTYQFGDELLTKTYQNNTEIVEKIKPMLENWDIERLSAIDMVLLKMAVSELRYFPSIPTKVTINEYIDISKFYSTEKSKEFVNGILDRMMKRMKESGEIQKQGRGLVED